MGINRHGAELYASHGRYRYHLLESLYLAGYTIQGLRRLLSENGKALSTQYCKDLLTERTSALSIRQAYLCAGLLGCGVGEVLYLIAQQNMHHKDLLTARHSKWYIEHPDPMLNGKIKGSQLKQEDIPLPGWLKG